REPTRSSSNRTSVALNAPRVEKKTNKKMAADTHVARTRIHIVQNPGPLEAKAPTIGFAEPEAASIMQHHFIVAAKHGLQFLYPLEVYDHRAMDAREGLGIELLLEARHCFAVEVLLLAHVQAHVIARSLDPVDFRKPEEESPAAGVNKDALGV